MKHLHTIIRGGIFAVLLLPLVFTSRTMYPWHFGKTVLFQIAVDILIFLGALYLYKTKEKLFRLRALDWAVFAFLGAYVIAAIFSIDPIQSVWGYQSRAGGVVVLAHLVLLYALLRQFFVHKNHWRQLLIWIVGIGTISAVIGWIGPHLSFFEGKVSTDARLSGLVGNPLFFAAYLLFPTMFSFMLFASSSKHDWKRWIYGALGIGMLLTLLSAQIRGVFVGIVVGVVVSCALFVFFAASKKQKKMTLAIVGGLAVLGFGAYLLFQNSPTLRSSFPVVGRLLDIRLSGATVQTRLMAWDIAIAGWLDHPVFGSGPENFQYIFDQYYNPAFLRFSFAETVWDRPHNFFLEILSTTGAVGALAYLGLLFILYKYILRLIKEETASSDRIGYIILAGGLSAYIVQSLFGIETTNALQLWFVALAFVGSMYAYDKKKNAAAGRRIGALALVFVFIVAGYFVYKHTTFYRASVYMSDARDAADIGAVDLWKEKAVMTLGADVPFLPEQAKFTIQDISRLDGHGLINGEVLGAVSARLVDILTKAVERNPDIYQHHFWLGELYAVMGEYIDPMYIDKAIEELETAGRLSPGQQRVPLTLAKNYLLQDRTADAVAILEDLVEQDPTLSEPRWFLGLALIEDGQEDRGLAELEASLSFGKTFRGNALYLINIYAGRQEYDKIIPLYEYLIDRYPSDASLYASLAATYAALGETDQVIRYLNIAVQLDPTLKQEALLFLEQQGIQRPEIK